MHPSEEEQWPKSFKDTPSEIAHIQELEYESPDEHDPIIPRLPHNYTAISSGGGMSSPFFRTPTSHLPRNYTAISPRTLASSPSRTANFQISHILSKPKASLTKLLPRAPTMATFLSSLTVPDLYVTPTMPSTLYFMTHKPTHETSTRLPDTLHQLWKERVRDVLERQPDSKNLKISKCRVKKVMKMDETVVDRYMFNEVR
jgi:hypothetical protein